MRQDTALERLYAQLRDELEETVAEAGATPAMPPRVAQGIWAFAPWLLLALFFVLVPGVRPSEGVGNLLGGMAILAVPFTVGGVLLPTSWPSLVTRIVYPFGGTLLVVFALTAWSKRQGTTSQA